MKPQIIQCDIDGTVCDTRELIPQKLAGNITTDELEYDTAVNPKPIRPVVAWLRSRADEGAEIHYVTGRHGAGSAEATLDAIDAPPGQIHANTDREEPGRFKYRRALSLRPDVILEDDPAICTLMEVADGVDATVVRVPGWFPEESPDAVTRVLPHTPPAPNPTGDGAVALYSGGVDSYCMAVLEQPDVLLHVNLGGEYGAAESQALRTPPGMEDRLVTLDLPLLGDMFEMPDREFILPARNAILTLLGAQYGNRVMMASIAASRGSDKDEQFADLMTRMLRYVWQPQVLWNPEGRDTRLELPVEHLTKAELVAATIRAGIPGEVIRDNTFSCYTPTPDGKPCGKCGPCGRKWGAFAANDVDPGFDGRAAYEKYMREVEEHAPNIPPGRTYRHVQDVKTAWASRW